MNFRPDPNGEFVITYDRVTWEIVVEHSFGGMKLGEYRHRTAERIEQMLDRDCAISEIGHALYIGRELTKKEIEMKNAKKAAGV